MTFSRIAPAITLALTLPALAVSAHAQRGQRGQRNQDTQSSTASQCAPAADTAHPLPERPLLPPAHRTHPNTLTPSPTRCPPNKSVPQTITVNGKTLHYTATVGTITLKSNTPSRSPPAR